MSTVFSSSANVEPSSEFSVTYRLSFGLPSSERRRSIGSSSRPLDGLQPAPAVQMCWVLETVAAVAATQTVSSGELVHRVSDLIARP
jgi:hypothetical protein